MAHFTLEQRYITESMLKEGKGYAEIGREIGKDETSVKREYDRNKDFRSGKYSADLAHRKATKRKQEKNTRCDMTPEVKAYIEKQIRKRLSPEQIAGEAKKKGIKCVSHETTYKHVWANKKAGGDLHTFLRNKGKKYRKRGHNKKKRGLFAEKVSIEKRPMVVEERERFGDWEVDTIVGKNHKGAILTLNDRATGLIRMQKLKGKDPHGLKDTVVELLQATRTLNNTITSDNGIEFAQFKQIAEEAGIDYYFAHPYHSWERGSNENLNGLVRQYIPKGTDFSTVTDEYIQYVEDELNERPRKRFGYCSPNEIFQTVLH